MARDQEPLTAGELAALADTMDEQAASLREALADDLGGAPEDYRPHRVANGGD